MIDLRRMTREFLLGESFNKPSIRSYVQSLEEILHSFRMNTKRDVRRVEIAKSHVKEIKSHVKKLEEQVNLLEEKLSVLEENKGN